jgi:hypothetical protein
VNLTKIKGVRRRSKQFGGVADHTSIADTGTIRLEVQIQDKALGGKESIHELS